jgi:hypothetical protein
MKCLLKVRCSGIKKWNLETQMGAWSQAGFELTRVQKKRWRKHTVNYQR